MPAFASPGRDRDMLRMQRHPRTTVRGVGFLETLALAALASVAGPAPVCSAVSLTLAYSGYVFSEHPGAPYSVATPFEGTVTYDSGVSPDFVEGSNRAEYLFQGGLGAVSFSIGEARFEGVTSDDAEVAMLQLVVENDYASPGPPPSRPRDRYLYLYDESQVGILAIEFRTLASLFTPPDLESIQSLEIPTSASQFQRLAMATVRYQDPIGEWIVDGSITSITVVPEPSTFYLIALGVVALFSARRCARPPTDPEAVEGMGRPRRPPHP